MQCDSALTTKRRETATSSACNCHIRNVACKILAHVLFKSRQEYSSAVLESPKYTDGTSEDDTEFYSPTSYPHKHITSDLKSLRWLPVVCSTRSWILYVNTWTALQYLEEFVVVVVVYHPTESHKDVVLQTVAYVLERLQQPCGTTFQST